MAIIAPGQIYSIRKMLQAFLLMLLLIVHSPFSLMWRVAIAWRHLGDAK